MYVLGVFDDSNNDLDLLEKEKKNFQGYMSQLMDEEDFKYEAYSGTKTLKELMEFIDSKKDKLTWFHFSGHHDVKGGIKIFDGDFSSLVGHLQRCNNLKGIFINGCDSKSTLDKLSDKVPICIGTTKPVYDGIATEFSDMFYKKLQDSKNWKEYDTFYSAFEETKEQIRNLSEADTIKNVNTEARGGGALENFKLAEDFYYMAPETKEGENIFYDRTAYEFNVQLIQGLIDLLKEKQGPASFLENNPSLKNNDWNKGHLKEASTKLLDTFVWIISKQLSRLFAIGKIEDGDLEKKCIDYLKVTLDTYRLSLLLVNYVFISGLWDEKRKNPKIETDTPFIRKFFNTQVSLKLNELRLLFNSMINIFEKEENITYPLEKEHIGDVSVFVDENSAFNTACSELEKLDSLDSNTGVKISECRIAEKSLLTVLKGFKFLADYKLLNIKKIEYEGSRNSEARYIKDWNVLDKNQPQTPLGYMEIDTSPAQSYTVEMTNGRTKINLHPFLLDFNALINVKVFKLYLYQSLNEDHGINYLSMQEAENKGSNALETINYIDAKAKRIEKIKDEDYKKDLQKKIRLDLVTKHFEDAMHLLIDSDFTFKPKVEKSIEVEDILFNNN